MSEGTYNGWSNYETWCVSMWLDNDEGNYHAVRELTSEARYYTHNLIGYADADTLRSELADRLKDYVEELPEVVAVTEGPASFVTDLLGAALSEVDWQEIAENLISEVK